MDDMIERFRKLNQGLYTGESLGIDDQQKARNFVYSNSEGEPSTICEICGQDASKIKTEVWHTGTRHKHLVAHHWRGYGHPLDVWWVCYSCNRLLRGHDGEMTKEQARAFIKNRFLT